RTIRSEIRLQGRPGAGPLLPPERGSGAGAAQGEAKRRRQVNRRCSTPPSPPAKAFRAFSPQLPLCAIRKTVHPKIYVNPKVDVSAISLSYHLGPIPSLSRSESCDQRCDS